MRRRTAGASADACRGGLGFYRRGPWSHWNLPLREGFQENPAGFPRPKALDRECYCELSTRHAVERPSVVPAGRFWKDLTRTG